MKKKVKMTRIWVRRKEIDEMRKIVKECKVEDTKESVKKRKLKKV